MQETSWVRSLYLYVMCAASVVLVGLGAVGFVVGAVHTIAPDLGHRDTLDRVGIGLANVASDVLDLMNEGEGSDSEAFCRDVTDNSTDFEDCMSSEGTGQEVDAIQDGIGELRSELQSQIRNNSIDHMIRGLLLIGAGVLLFRIHGRRTELFADGLIPKPPEPPEPAPAAAPTPTPAPAPAPDPTAPTGSVPPPPPPGAPPAG